MENIKFVIQYDGTKYKGWQSQGNADNTIQGRITEVLRRMVGTVDINQSTRTLGEMVDIDGNAHGHRNLVDIKSVDDGRGNLVDIKSVDDGRRNQVDINLIGSGRTDAGVHALGQVANCHLEWSPQYADMSDADLLNEINRKLPDDIAIISLSHEDERFHARYSAIGKTYRYRIHVSPIASVFEQKYVYNYSHSQFDTDAMRRSARDLLGEHDFTAFCGNRHMKKSAVRTITSIEISEIRDENGLQEIVIDYSGNGFLQNMVRIMTGTLIEIGTHQRDADCIPAILASKDRTQAGYTAPAQGLSLIRVTYP